MDPRDTARFLQAYSKRFGAGAFATPTAKELAGRPGDVIDLRAGDDRTVIVTKTITRDSARTDWLGRRYLVPSGSRIATHTARTPAGPVPDLDRFDLVYTYPEDRPLTAALEAQGREVRAHKISAASEVIAAWGRSGEAYTLPNRDRATCGEVPGPTVMDQEAIRAEVAAITGWDDDYPFYSDGSWGAVSLRGFWPEDPTRGVKPAEMSKAWKAEHLADLDRSCDWTTLAARCPATVAAVESIPWITGMERVRLLRMAGRDGKGGKLARHTDITDRNSGTEPGQIVRFHLPLVTDPAIKMTVWELDGTTRSIHLSPWRLWYLDARKPHAVANPTGVDRIHLVVDAVVTEQVAATIAATAP